MRHHEKKIFYLVRGVYTLNKEMIGNIRSQRIQSEKNNNKNLNYKQNKIITSNET